MFQSAEKQTFKKLRKLYDVESVQKKANILSKLIGVPLPHIKGCTYDTSYFKGNIENPIGIVQCPLGIAGPLQVKGEYADGNFFIPMATTEGALILTYDFGMRLFNMAGPITTEITSKVVHITPMFPIKTDEDVRVSKFVSKNYEIVKQVAENGSKHTKLLRIEQKIIGKNFLLKFIYDTADAHGLNMINHATFSACQYTKAKTGAFFYLRSHYSGVKHHSLLNEETGYGRVVKARGTVSSSALDMLEVNAHDVKDFCDRCIECGHAAGIQSVNVHAANGIAAIFLACGQDVADISSAHVCRGKCEVINKGKDLLWECELRNLLVGTVGGGTCLGTQSECLKIMRCFGTGQSDKFAELIAATVLAGEFPTAAAVVNRSYVDIHNRYGRNKNKIVS
jgi:hydroxymethylglutaryl-CoA reductase (NADPH)